MIIKNHINRNDYCLSKSGHWIRDFTKKLVKPHDINDIMTLEDIKLMIENEFKNEIKKYQTLEASGGLIHEKVAIIGDGYGFQESMKIINDLPPDVTILGVNGAFAKWSSEKRLHYYIVNNPYNECLYFYPQIIRSWPKCIASIRTNPSFLEVYKGQLYTYIPANGETYKGISNDHNLFIDDYRNPICAAINIAYKFGAKKMLLMSTIEMYNEDRPGCELAKSGLWIYPQQRVAHSIIDANLYWMKKAKIDVSYLDSELDYEFATYIKVDELKRFFNDGQK